MNRDIHRHLNGPLAVIFFAVAVYALTQSVPPITLKLVIVVGAYVIFVHWLYQYSPYAARWIVSTTLLIIFAIIKGILSCASGGRRR